MTQEKLPHRKELCLQSDTNNKFVCGILFEIKGVKYYAPISHTVKKFRQVRIIN